MRKILVIFLAAVTVSAAGILAVSCNSAVKEEFGTVFIDIGALNASRAIGENGLPDLSSSEMTVKVTKADVSPYSVITEKTFAAAEPKTMSLTVPVGEKIKVRVTVKNAAARWSGETEHTVTAGTNTISVKIKKSAAALNSLLFGTDKTHPGGHHDYTLTLNIGSKEIKKERITAHSFCRDSKGRTYITYREGSDFKLERYTSEGERDIAPKQIDVSLLAYDYAAEKLYGLEDRSLKEIDDAINTHEVTSARVGSIFAVDNGRLITGSLNDGFYLSKIGSKNKNDISPDGFESYVRRFGLEGVYETEFFIRGDYLYILLSGFQDTSSQYSNQNVYSLGAVIKWKLGEKEVTPAQGGDPVMLPDLVGEPVLIGKPEGNPVFENHVLKDYDYSKYFYGAVKVIGFDENTLYIADDGFDAKAVGNDPKITANRNRIAMLNTETNSLTFTDADTAKWEQEFEEWTGGRVIVWTKNTAAAGFGYYQLEKGWEDTAGQSAFPAHADIVSDAFCFDAAGNLYIAVADSDGFSYMFPYSPDNDGSYNTSSGDRENITGSQPAAMAVSDGLETGRQILFFVESYGNSIRRQAGGRAMNAITLTDVNPHHSNTITAIAANKDGIFVAVKTMLDGNSDRESYKIEVRKYEHQPLGEQGNGVSAGAIKTVTVVGETSTNHPVFDPHAPNQLWTPEQANAYIDETVNALYIQDGVLYALTTKQRGKIDQAQTNEVFIGGKLLRIGETGSSFGSGIVEVLYQNEGLTAATSGEFAPYRFIAFKPQKLVIASDGYYGKFLGMEHGEPNVDAVQKNKVFVFDIGNWSQPEAEPVHNTITFSKELDYSSQGLGFRW